jgi:predicted RNA-binding Zn-ribbon protein involved in translation (DUF1610 family)
LSAAARTVAAMTNHVQQTLEVEILDDPCPRCGSDAVRVVASLSVAVIEADAAADGRIDDEPLFDCRECGFEWGELIRDLMS